MLPPARSRTGLRGGLDDLLTAARLQSEGDRAHSAGELRTCAGSSRASTQYWAFSVGREHPLPAQAGALVPETAAAELLDGAKTALAALPAFRRRQGLAENLLPESRGAIGAPTADNGPPLWRAALD
jgi:hypothetical protein